MKTSRLTFILIFLIFLSGCASQIPNECFKPPEDLLQRRELQSRIYETDNETLVLLACSGVLQDLGFILEESEIQLGVIGGTKDRTATNNAQVALALTADIINAMAGYYSNSYGQCDDVQKIKVVLVTKLSDTNKNNIIIRITFQRIVWNKQGNVSRVETLKDEELYTGFFEKLSKAIFLEAHKI